VFCKAPVKCISGWNVRRGLLRGWAVNEASGGGGERVAILLKTGKFLWSRQKIAIEEDVEEEKGQKPKETKRMEGQLRS